MNLASFIAISSRFLGGLLLFAVIAPPAHAFSFTEEPLNISQALRQETQNPQNTMNEAGLRTLYGLQDNKPLWVTKGLDDRQPLEDLVQAIRNFAKFNGLQSANDSYDEIENLIRHPSQETDARLDILLSSRVLDLIHDLNGQRVNLSQLYVGWDFTKEKRDLVAGLFKAIEHNTLQDYFSSLLPANGDYLRLADSLKQYREIRAKGGWPVIPYGETIKPGSTDPRLTLIRERLVAEGYLTAGDKEAPLKPYGEDLENAVIAYQSRNMLESDGVIGGRTLRAMNVSVQRRIEQIKANMERMRHLPRNFPSRYAIVNIADTSVKVVENGSSIYHSAVITGRPDRKSPFIQSKIRTVIFNPSWHVPSRIAREDILPKLRKDPRYLEKQGIVIKQNGDQDPHGRNIDWKNISPSEFTFRLRQEPGAMNALGQIKFDFDNDYAVYMHGTPHEELFSKADRHLSSGCVRLEDPVSFATIVLRDNEGNWDKDKVETYVDAAKTRWIQVSDPLPVYFVYQTVTFPTPDGPAHFTQDDYNYDQILIDALRESRS